MIRAGARQFRRSGVRFRFIWNESDPAFSCAAGMLSFLFVAIEKMISATVHEAMSLITDPRVAEEV